MKAICTKGKTTTIKVVRGKTPGSSMARTEPMILATSLISSKDITRMTNNVLKDPLLVLMAFSMMEEITCATRAVATKLVRATREIGSPRKNFKVTGRKISLARKMLEAGRAQQTIDLWHLSSDGSQCFINWRSKMLLWYVTGRRSLAMPLILSFYLCCFMLPPKLLPSHKN